VGGFALLVFTVAFVLTALQRYGKNKSPTEAMRKYLAVVSQFPLYGCTKVFAHYRGVWAYGVETIIAVNYDGIKLISVQEKKLAVDIYYSEIEEILLQVIIRS
jgi:hypothetical protein